MRNEILLLLSGLAGLQAQRSLDNLTLCQSEIPRSSLVVPGFRRSQLDAQGQGLRLGDDDSARSEPILLLLGVAYLAFLLPAQATLTFTSPLSGTVFYRGGKYPISYTDSVAGTNPLSYTWKWKITATGSETTIASSELSAATIAGSTASITWDIPTSLAASTNYILTAYSGSTAVASTATFSIQVPAITNLRLSIPVGTTVNATISFNWAGPTGYGLDINIYGGTSTTRTAIVSKSVVAVSGTSQSFLATISSASTVLLNEIEVEASVGQIYSTKVSSPTDSNVSATATYTVTSAGFANQPSFWLLSAIPGGVECSSLLVSAL